MAKSPRVIRGPNGGLLNVDVTMLRLGLSRCRSFAEQALTRMQMGHEVDYEAVFNDIVEMARETLFQIEEDNITDEVGAVLRDEEIREKV